MSADVSVNQVKKGKRGPKPLNDLTPAKQRLWQAYYVGQANFNATEACRLAGFQGTEKSLGQLGSKLLKKFRESNKLEERIAARIEASRITAAEVVGILAEQARANVDDITDSKGNVDLKKIKRKKLGHLVKSITPTKFGARVQMVSQFAAAQQLCKVFGIEKAPSDGAREARDKALTAAANNLALMLGVTFEAAMERVRAAADARSGAVLALPAAGESSDAVS